MSGRRRFILASVIAVQNSSFVYPSCPSCFSRIILGSARFRCPRCGCQGETKNASYRYKLSLQVAEENQLFAITVFGSCLNPFFGLPASLLRRYVQDSEPPPGTPDNDAVWDLLLQAVQTCFAGRSFIFGVTMSGGLGPAKRPGKWEIRVLILPPPVVAQRAGSGAGMKTRASSQPGPGCSLDFSRTYPNPP
ncbi:DNA damage-induced apoptosis suppressor protein isoform X2 [Ornithorhynchus anatinus]|uniref:DNA damage-induced apoptosis suppressor protein isoform X2 n=1 Tax=Ornithorhynchus anatinus TaxID=9258 RepID=UPI0010A77B02|nr:DNA damage-induced apoptosis suppressor protein isoform X2 [Ornithorhynchus anatinus]